MGFGANWSIFFCLLIFTFQQTIEAIVGLLYVQNLSRNFEVTHGIMNVKSGLLT